MHNTQNGVDGCGSGSDLYRVYNVDRFVRRHARFVVLVSTHLAGRRVALRTLRHAYNNVYNRMQISQRIIIRVRPTVVFANRIQ